MSQYLENFIDALCKAKKSIKIVLKHIKIDTFSVPKSPMCLILVIISATKKIKHTMSTTKVIYRSVGSYWKVFGVLAITESKLKYGKKYDIELKSCVSDVD